MQDLLGRTFSVGDGEYRVVDVRRFPGEILVYAEETELRRGDRRPKRAAFHYGDIASRFEQGPTVA